MKNKIVLILFTLLIISCNSKQQENKINKEDNQQKETSPEINNKLIEEIDTEQQSYFKKNHNYELLSIAKGSLFQENSNDFAFIVYDKKNEKISILLYNEKSSTYAELYKDIKVINDLKDANC